MIRELHVVPFPVIFIWFYDQDWQERVLKVMKNYHFLVAIVVWALSPKFLESKGVTYVRIA